MSEARRGKLKARVTAAVLCLLIAAPSSICTAFFLSQPVHPRQQWISAVRLTELPANGEPSLVNVQLFRHNAWQRVPGRSHPVYVLSSHDDVVVFQSYFHEVLRLPLDYDSNRSLFVTACWRIEFSLDGECLSSSHSDCRLHRIPARTKDGQVYVQL